DEDFQPTWMRFYAPRRALNLGFSGDTTANVLWRLQHGEVAAIHPKVAILLIGTNDTDTAGRGADETARGIDAVVAELERRLPRSLNLLICLLPSSISAINSATDAALNRQLAARYRTDRRVTYRDIGGVLRRADGSLDEAIFYDPRLTPPRPALHP